MTLLRRSSAVFLLAALLLAAACQPAAQQVIVVEALPTVAPLALPPDLEGAASVAINFLEDWRLGDYAAMYDQLAFSSREAYPADVFTRFYQSAAETMTLESLSSTGVTLYRDPTREDVAVFNYNMTFTTRLIGSFEDNGRDMQLVYDPGTESWRVAWTPADIFAELRNGGQLRLDMSIPSRANIYDRRDRVLADQSGRMVIVRAVKQAIPDWAACQSVLAYATGRDPADLQRLYDRSSADWMVEWGVIEPAVYEANQAQLQATCGAEFGSRPVRQYPNGTIMPNIVGVVGYPNAEAIPDLQRLGFNGDTILGQSGIEASWDDRLRGSPGGRLVIVSTGGGILREIARTPSRPPESVWLTVDMDLQAGVARILDEYYAKMELGKNSNGAAAVVLDVNTGAILALVSYPTYDINAFAPFSTLGRARSQQLVTELQNDPRRPLLNRATQGVYPLGSVMKTASTIAVADTGVYALNQRYSCSGIWTRDITRYDWLPGGHGTITLSQALTRSCNPYYYEVGYQLNQFDPNALPSYIRRLGLGVPTGLQDVAEATGLVPDPEWKRVNTGIEWTFSDAVNLSIGQGEVQVTPLQVARMFAAIANGGTLYRPQLVQKAGILGETPSYTFTPDPMANINIRPEVLDVVREGLCNVTSTQAGTAEYQFRNDAELQTLGVCGKTGTAQNRPGAVTHAWFAAYAPREEPEIAVVVIVENGGEGSGTAAPIVRDIMDFYFFQVRR
jgi:penicillin-binding protein 2